MRYVWRNGAFRHPTTNKPMPVPRRSGVVMPAVRSDIEPYKSPIDDSVVSSRSTQRYDLEKNDCVLAPPSKVPFHPEEYRWRKAQQAKELAKRRSTNA